MLFVKLKIDSCVLQRCYRIFRWKSWLKLRLNRVINLDCKSRFLSVQCNAQHWTEYKITYMYVFGVWRLWTRLWRDLWTDLHQIWNIASPRHARSNKVLFSRLIGSSKRACMTINRWPFAKFGNFNTQDTCSNEHGVCPMPLHKYVAQ